MPQIELMSADLPHTLYHSKKKNDEADMDDAIRKTREAAERKRRAMEAGQYTVQDIFDGVADDE